MAAVTLIRGISSSLKHLWSGTFQKVVQGGGKTPPSISQIEAVEPQYLWQQHTQVRTKFIGWRMKKDHHRREIVRQFGPERLRINAIRKNSILPKELQEIASEEIHQFPRDSNVNRIKNRCILSGRSRGNIRRFKMNRMNWRHLADYNHLSGVKRSQW